MSSVRAMAWMRALLIITPAAILGCGSSSTPGESVLHPLDLELPDEAESFDADNVLSSVEFADTSDATLVKLNEFLANTPYGTASFLSNYRAGSVSASSALMHAATAFGVHPAALLARLEMEQGLVALTRYPPTAARVEYVFRCGCAGAECDPALAGLDKQLDCMALRWANARDRIAREGATLGGWSIGMEKESTDGVLVTPNNAATCAMYEELGEVGDGSRGTSLFYAVFTRYRSALSSGAK